MLPKSTPVKPKYLQETDTVLQSLRSLVNAHVKQQESTAYLISATKTIALFTAFFAVYFLLLTNGTNATWIYCCYLLLGVLMMTTFLNILHPAAHHSLFRKRIYNEIALYGFELFGTSGFLWKTKHNRLHHPFPNIPQWDCDMEQSSLVRIFPESKYHSTYKLQAFYAPVLYLLYTLNWIFYRDFTDFFSSTRIVKKVIQFPAVEVVKLFAFKLLYLGYMIYLPWAITGQSLMVILTGFLLMHLLASSIGMIALVSTHAGEETTFTYPDQAGNVDQSWLEHQLTASNDFAPDNKFVSFLFGYLNHHVVHHLFPNLNPDLSPGATRLLKKFAREHNLPYRSYAIRQTLYSHLKLLQRNSQLG